MIKICVVTNPQSAATDYYRSVAPLYYIEKATGGAIQIDPVTPPNIDWHQLFTSDVVFFSRPNGSALLDIITEVKDMGKQVWVDYDDLLDGLSEYNPAKVHFNRPEVIESVKLIMAIADQVTVSTDFLRDKYLQYAKNDITVIRNAYDSHLFSLRDITPQQDPIKLHWRGSATHLGDLMTIKRSIDYAIKSGAWHMKFHGLEDWMLHAYPKGFEIASWENRLFRYFRTFQEEVPDWVIFPLIDDDFNQSKSNISAIEALVAGAGVLAPAGFPEFDFPGVIKYDSVNHLKKIMKGIEAGEIKKEVTVQYGREWLAKNLTVEQENQKRMKVIEALTGARFIKKVA